MREAVAPQRCACPHATFGALVASHSSSWGSSRCERRQAGALLLPPHMAAGPAAVQRRSAGSVVACAGAGRWQRQPAGVVPRLPSALPAIRAGSARACGGCGSPRLRAARIASAAIGTCITNRLARRRGAAASGSGPVGGSVGGAGGGGWGGGGLARASMRVL
jgi:hypothetical protein